jgi:hypothetical protein
MTSGEPAFNRPCVLKYTAYIGQCLMWHFYNQDLQCVLVLIVFLMKLERNSEARMQFIDVNRHINKLVVML